jgi:hypothetical protein
VVAAIDEVKVVEVLDCNTVPPVAAEYHLKVGVVNPLVSITEAVGTPAPHCDESVADGAVGCGLTVTMTVPLLAHPLAILVAVTV